MIRDLMKEPQLLCREHLTQQSQHLPKILEHTWLQVWESRNGVDKETKAVVENGIWADRREEDLPPTGRGKAETLRKSA